MNVVINMVVSKTFKQSETWLTEVSVPDSVGTDYDDILKYVLDNNLHQSEDAIWDSISYAEDEIGEDDVVYSVEEISESEDESEEQDSCCKCNCKKTVSKSCNKKNKSSKNPKDEKPTLFR